MEDSILIFKKSEVSGDLQMQVAALINSAWPGLYSPPGVHLHDPLLSPVSMLLVDQGKVLSSLVILSKRITHCGQNYAASGLSSVVTLKEARGKGHGRRLVIAAREFIRSQDKDLGIFTSDAYLRPFYESCGWQVLPNSVLIGGTADQPFASDQFDKVTYASFFTQKAIEKAESFRNSRIALYPGLIDKLW